MITITGYDLTLEDVVRVARHHEEVRLHPDALERIKVCRRMLEKKIEAHEIMYGVNTGIGEFSEVILNDEQIRDFQKYLIYNHAAGIGEAAPEEHVRAAMLGRINVHAHGNSGCRPEITLTLDGRRERIPIRLQVWPFAIPDECSMVADMNAYAPGVVRGWSDLAARGGEACGSREYLTAERNTFRCAHEHRALYHYLPYAHSGLIPHPNFIPRLEGEGEHIRVRSWAEFDRHFGPYLDGSAFRDTRRGPIPIPFIYTPQNFHWPADFAKFGKPGYRTEWRRIGQAFVDHFRQKGWTSTRFELFFNHKQRWKYFPWDGDETRFPEDTDIFYHFRDLSAGIYDRAQPVRFVWRIDSSWLFPVHWKSELSDFVKLWVVNSHYQAETPESVEPMRKKGCTVFHYGGASPLEVPLSWVWLWPAKTLARGIDGFTWWLATGWNERIWWHSPDRYATCVFYPGTPWDGREVFGGIRAKVMRNAMQTIEYAYLLDRRRGAGRALDIINRVLGIDSDFWWDRASAPPRSGSDAASIPIAQVRDPLSWQLVRRRLAEALIEKGKKD